MAERDRLSFARYSRRTLERHPLAYHLGLHVIAPVAVVLVAILLTAGAVRPVARSSEDVGKLITSPAAQAKYRALKQEIDALARRQRGRAMSAQVAQQRAAAVNGLFGLATAAKLRGCVQDGSGVECDGHRVRDSGISLFYAAGAIIAILVTLSFIIGVYSKLWMLPYWSPRLWYTPVCAVIIAMITCGPFLMAAVYFRRADNDYHVPVDQSGMPTPSLVLYVLLVLQVTVVLVALINAKTPLASIFYWTWPPLVASFVAVYLLLLWSGAPRLLVLGLVVLGFVAVPLQALLRKPSNRRGHEHGPPRILQLSSLLAVAWVLFALDRLLGVEDMAHNVLIGVCLLVCAVSVLISKAVELGLGRHPSVTTSVPAPD